MLRLTRKWFVHKWGKGYNEAKKSSDYNQ